LPEQLERRYGVPLIVIGMHRSGTSLVTRLLRACGGYFGSELDNNSEPVQVIRINKRLLRRWGASWQRLPPEFSARRRARHTLAVWVATLRSEWLWHGLFESFGDFAEEGGAPARPAQGWLPAFFVSWPAPARRVDFWGWKDPRNTLTLPVWLELFPNARILHVVRSGVDAALSLRARALRRGVGAPECLDLGYCFELWERYVEEGCAWRALPPSRYREVRYEDLLADPRAVLPRLVAFAGGDPERATSPEVLALCRTPAACDRSAHPELLERARKSAWLRELGYEAGPESALARSSLPAPAEVGEERDHRQTLGRSSATL
jgi:hypothetical protein